VRNRSYAFVRLRTQSSLICEKSNGLLGSEEYDLIVVGTEATKDIRVQSNPVITSSIYATPRYNVGYSVVPINSSLLTINLYSSVITALFYNDTKYSVRSTTL
jgi:hypothetical protein